MKQNQKFSASAGIAIGPILFILAMIGAIGVYMSSGNDSYTSASTADRVTSNIVSQANLIRSAINQCNLQYLSDISLANSTPGESYPYGSATGTATAVSLLQCDPDLKGTSSLWSDKTLPANPGFGDWTYYNAGSTTNERCFYTIPTTMSAATTQGLTTAANKFNNATAWGTGTGQSKTAEVYYNPAGTTGKFVVIVTPPTTGNLTTCAP